MHQRYVAVCGASEATPSQLVAAREVGRLLARHGAVVINGGFGGVMGAASEGAASEGGTGVGILPDTDRGGANPHLDRKSTRLNSSHLVIPYAGFCLKQKSSHLVISYAAFCLKKKTKHVAVLQ